MSADPKQLYEDFLLKLAKGPSAEDVVDDEVANFSLSNEYLLRVGLEGIAKQRTLLKGKKHPAIRVLAARGGPQVFDLALSFLESDDPINVKYGAALVFELEGNETLPLTARASFSNVCSVVAITATDEVLVAWLVAAMGRMRGPNCAETIMSLSADPSALVRQAVTEHLVEAFANNRKLPNEAYQVYLRLMGDSDPSVCCGALDAMGRRPEYFDSWGQSVLDACSKRMQDGDRAVEQHARAAYNAIAPLVFRNSKHPRAKYYGLTKPENTRLRDDAARVAKRDPKRALQIGRNIVDGWFACQAIAHAALELPEDEDWRAVAEEAFEKGKNAGDKYNVVSASCWPLKVLRIRKPEGDLLAKHGARLVELSKEIPQLSSRALALNTLMGALLGGPLELLMRAVDVLETTVCDRVVSGRWNKRGENAVIHWTPIIAVFDEARARQLASHIKGTIRQARALDPIGQCKLDAGRIRMEGPNI